MSKLWLLPLGVFSVLSFNGHAQSAPVSEPAAQVAAAPPTPSVAVPSTNGPERNISRQATPAGTELLLYPEPTETGKPVRISANRQLFIRSQIDSTWYRALYGGTQFYVKRTDVSLLTPSGPGMRGKAPRKPVKK